MDWVIASIFGYLLGSIPFGLILTRAFGAGNLREIGSGSIGATNVLRTGRKGLAAATVLLDLGKGVAAVLLARHFLPGAEGAAAIAAVVGHCFPVWLAFRGGKGFATAAGVCLALAWPVFLVCAAIWTVVAITTRISSLSSLAAVTASPIAAWLMGFPAVAPTLVAVAAIVIVKHHENIGRLMRGEEPKVGARS